MNITYYIHSILFSIKTNVLDMKTNYKERRGGSWQHTSICIVVGNSLLHLIQKMIRKPCRMWVR